LEISANSMHNKVVPLILFGLLAISNTNAFYLAIPSGVFITQGLDKNLTDILTQDLDKNFTTNLPPTFEGNITTVIAETTSPVLPDGNGITEAPPSSSYETQHTVIVAGKAVSALLKLIISFGG